MSKPPLSPELYAQLQALSPTELAFVAGYAWAKSEGGAQAVLPQAQEQATVAAPRRRILLLSASQTGNARGVAKKLYEALLAAGHTVSHQAVGDYKVKNLAGEEDLLLITSTQGDGEPPEEALGLYRFLHGKKAPNLKGLRFAVLGLGDRSYPQFCQAGKDFDARLTALGAERLLPVGECDLDFAAQAQQWCDEVAACLGKTAVTEAATAPSAAKTTQHYDKSHPCTATLLTRQKITARDADKDVRHIELDLSGTGLSYRAGDALGVWHENAPELVAEILAQHGLAAEEEVRLGEEVLPLGAALQQRLDITTLTPPMLAQYAAHAADDTLNRQLEHITAAEFCAAHPPAILFHEYPAPLGAQALADFFRALTPRLYSIASAAEEVGEEVHLCVGVVRYRHHDTTYTGAASGFLAERLEEEGAVRVFVEENPRFRLPEDGSVPVVMIGAGTGIAPFRAFMQQRGAEGATGENWLIYGNTRFTQDFLYQSEWLRWRDEGLLTRADLAWSRDQAEKVYVQDKIRACGAELWAALTRGAHLYVCGDAARMAKDVEAALLEVIARHGGKDDDDAADFLEHLRASARYQRDIY